MIFLVCMYAKQGQLGKRFFYYIFHIQCQKYLFTDLNLPYQNSKMFFTSNVKNNSIKTDLRTCNLQTIWSISYKSINQFWLNLPYRNGKTNSTSNVKKNPHFQIDIFVIQCKKHSRRNAFCSGKQQKQHQLTSYYYYGVRRSTVSKKSSRDRRVYSPNVSTIPITAMGCQQCIPFSVVKLKGKHCQKLS